MNAPEDALIDETADSAGQWTSIPGVRVHGSGRNYALISEDLAYRYTLGRRWSTIGAGHAVFVMLNPSTADALQDDPTIRRCIGFAKRLGLGGLHVVNLYAWRTKSPDAMFAAERVDGHNIVGPENDDTIRVSFDTAAAKGLPVIAAWGAGAGADRVLPVVALAAEAGVQLQALGVTKAGAPRHPLYVRADAPLIPWGVDRG